MTGKQMQKNMQHISKLIKLIQITFETFANENTSYEETTNIFESFYGFSQALFVILCDLRT